MIECETNGKRWRVASVRELADAREAAAVLQALDLSPLAVLELAWSRADPRWPDAFADGLAYLGRSLESLKP